MTPDQATLEIYSLVSQIIAAALQGALLLAALWAGIAAYRQIDAFKLFELLRYTQDESFREARRAVIREIRPVRESEWYIDQRLESLASTCCAHYDVLSAILQFNCSRHTKRFFVKNWHKSIIITYDILESFLDLRSQNGGNSYPNFRWLREQARRQGYNSGPLDSLT